MRAISLTAGLLGFAAIASGGDGVMFKSATNTYHAEYTYAPGTSEQAPMHFVVTRKFKFRFPDASINKADPSKMALDENYTIREYLESDVTATVKAAQKKAAADGEEVNEILQPMLKKLRFKQVDCRVVARNMVEHLISNRIKATSSDSGRESQRYQSREDLLDVALVAKQLDQVTIMRDSSIGTDDIEPRFTCRRTVVDGEIAKCGDLILKFNPLEAQGGAFKGQKAVVFNPEGCGMYNDMNFKACELLVQVQRCGLRYTQKAEGARAANADTRGLDDFLEANVRDEVRARQDGRYKPGVEAANAQATDSFYGEFQTPGSVSKQPAH